MLLFSCNSLYAFQPQWPEITQTSKPWTRWWWFGSAVNKEGLTFNMDNLHKAGIGGVEITPIYGVKGCEKQSISFESPEWMKMLSFTLSEGKRMGMGVDMTNASGWPFGGPWVQANDACKNVRFLKFSIKGGERLKEKVLFIQQPLLSMVGLSNKSISDIRFPVNSNFDLQKEVLAQVRFKKLLPLQSLMAYNDSGEILNLTGKVIKNGTLDWIAPAGNWNLYAVFQGWHGKMVERAGKGGEGNVIDHFSEKAIKDFLNNFDKNSKGTDVSGIRAFFNDSYEVDDASGESDWTTLFFDEFQKRRGYDLRKYLPALCGDDSEEKNIRVICDFRETISDLLLDRFTLVWRKWAWEHHSIIRNQAHGSPANILDLYAASDIPETEGISVNTIKMASSAGHVTGKKLISAESCTWLDEHFKATLKDIKKNLDRYMVNGINHIFYHGTPYSPSYAKWPGWLFYAAVNFAPSNTWWSDMKAVNQYVSRCQSFLQDAVSDNDFLVYFPVYDDWSAKGSSLLVHLQSDKVKLVKDISDKLVKEGYSFDYISDRQLQNSSFSQNIIKTEGGSYKTIIIPSCHYIPLKTMKKLKELASGGVKIVFQNKLPDDVPGLFGLKERRNAYKELLGKLDFKYNGSFFVAKVSKGQFIVGDSAETMLSSIHLFPEPMAQKNLWFTRVKRNGCPCYFISNWSGKNVEGWIPLLFSGKDAVWFDPMSGEKGKARWQKKKGNVYIQLKTGQSMILQFYSQKIKLPYFPVLKEQNQRKNIINGEWTVSFMNGGPVLPAPVKITKLKSWTKFSKESEYFSGTANYHISFQKPSDKVLFWELDLGKVCCSADIYMNGHKLGVLIGPSWKIRIDSSLMKKVNFLDIRVSNLMANRIIYMDRNGENYKKFNNVNFSAKFSENVGKHGLFDASGWNPLDSGLIGPVILTPCLNKKNF